MWEGCAAGAAPRGQPPCDPAEDPGAQSRQPPPPFATDAPGSHGLAGTLQPAVRSRCRQELVARMTQLPRDTPAPLPSRRPVLADDEVVACSEAPVLPSTTQHEGGHAVLIDVRRAPWIQQHPALAWTVSYVELALKQAVDRLRESSFCLCICEYRSGKHLQLCAGSCRRGAHARSESPRSQVPQANPSRSHPEHD